MYDDLLGKRNDKKIPKPKQIKWDIAVYEDQAYCYNCGGQDFTILNDKLTGDYLEKEVQCNACFAEWKEVWTKDIELELKELLLTCMTIY